MVRRRLDDGDVDARSATLQDCRNGDAGGASTDNEDLMVC
jgi:hypothetical protein